MSFSLSAFTAEVDGTPTIVFQAKWQAEADDILRGWADLHWEELSRKSAERSSKRAWPPILKLRLARRPEKEAYETENGSLELYGELKIVWLVEPPDVQGDTDTKPATDTQPSTDTHPDEVPPEAD